MANKRKRDESGDSDLDEVAPGRQTLPVANLPHDFDQEPQDGMQYLFLVSLCRRDARRLPHVTRVHNPYEVSETKVIRSFTPQLSANAMPCEEWRVVFQTHFSYLRKNLNQATIHVSHGHSRAPWRVVPEKKDRDAWWKFFAGHPEPVWAPKDRSIRRKLGRKRTPADPAGEVLPGDATSLPAVHSGGESFHFPTTCLSISPRNAPQLNSQDSPTVDIVTPSKEVQERLSPLEATPSHLRGIDHPTSIHLLMYFTHWINVHLQNPSDPLTTISISHGRWMFALLSRVEDRLSADEMNLLRNLARACLALIQRHSKHTNLNDAASEVPHPLFPQSMSGVSCWIIFAAVAGYWGQRDLWAEAEAMLAGGAM